MGMIRVSDEIEAKLKQLADGRSMTATIDLLFKMANSNANESVKMARTGACSLLQEHIDKRFDELKTLIEDTTVDRLASSSSKSNSNSSYGTPVDWETLRDLWLDFLPYGAEEWLPGREEAFRNSDNMDMGAYYIKNGLIVSDDTWGHADWMKVSSRVKDYLLSHGVEI